MNKLLVLGSTGSVGQQTLDLVKRNPDRFKVDALCANSNLDLLLEQVKEFKPKYIALSDMSAALKAEAALGNSIEIFSGANALADLVKRSSADLVVVAVVGFAALEPLMAAIESKKKIALANKECLVAGGDLVMPALEKNGAQLVPVDSEHSSIFQIFQNRESLRRITITASGGPFLRTPYEELMHVTASQAVRHPRWNMGAKISVDSATLMNKGLEVIEAAHLFNLSVEQIDVLVHPESVIHGLVEFKDGAVLACAFEADMRLPIAYALDTLSGNDLSTSGRTLETGIGRLNLAKWGTLNFECPDLERFPCLRLAYESFRIGGTAPTVLNGANEVAVDQFLTGRIRFLEIAEVVEEALSRHTAEPVDTFEAVLAADKFSRKVTSEIIAKRK